MIFEKSGGGSMRKTNGYGWFTAEYCKSTGLPMYDKKSYAAVADRYLSKTRCAKIKKPVNEGENPVAFYVFVNGHLTASNPRIFTVL